MIAQYVTVWDGGILISTPCECDPVNRLVSNAVSVTADVDTLEETYIELPDGEKIYTFYDEDNACSYLDGQQYNS